MIDLQLTSAQLRLVPSFTMFSLFCHLKAFKFAWSVDLVEWGLALVVFMLAMVAILCKILHPPLDLLYGLGCYLISHLMTHFLISMSR